MQIFCQVIQWLTYFIIYCILGWIIESGNVSIREKKWVNRGFLHGPYLPIYGSGAVVILHATVRLDHIVLIYLVGMVVATVWEYIIGVFMEQIFKVQYWDYSYRKIQFQGKICLVSSLFWGVLAVIMTEVIHEPVAHMVEQIDWKYQLLFVEIVGGAMLIDTVIVGREAFDIKKALETANKIKEEIEIIRMQIGEHTAEHIKQHLEELIQEKEHISKHLMYIRLFRIFRGAKSVPFHDILESIRSQREEEE